jgi:dienelactone hydrolase
MPFVDRDHVMIGGQSRGGILSVAYAGLHPAQIKGVINFVGGWVTAGCTTASPINQGLFQRGAHYPGDTLWLYGDGDPTYPLSHSQENFATFQAAGGKGTFNAFPEPESRGHYVVTNPNAWAVLMEAYLKRQGLPGGQ